MSGSKHNPQLPMDSSPKKERARGSKGGESASATVPGIQTYSGIGGSRNPESDYAFEVGDQVYNTQDIDPATGDYNKTARYVCRRQKSTGRSQYRLKDKPCNDITGKWVSEWIDEGELEEV